MATYADLEMKIIQWSEARKIIPNSTPLAQFTKMVSEMGELADATMKHDMDGIKDAIGDVIICMVNYCALQDINMVDCMQVAYDQIKHRTGMMLPSGVFQRDA